MNLTTVLTVGAQEVDQGKPLSCFFILPESFVAALFECMTCLRLLKQVNCSLEPEETCGPKRSGLRSSGKVDHCHYGLKMGGKGLAYFHPQQGA